MTVVVPDGRKTKVRLSRSSLCTGLRTTNYIPGSTVA